MLSKRGTRKLRANSFDHLTVQKRLWGFSLHDPRMRKQESKIYKTYQEVVEAAINGERPQKC